MKLAGVPSSGLTKIMSFGLRRDVSIARNATGLSSGGVEVNGLRINTRDGAAIKDVAVVRITATLDSEVVMVDAP
jgi:hypothetical protein